MNSRCSCLWGLLHAATDVAFVHPRCLPLLWFRFQTLLHPTWYVYHQRGGDSLDLTASAPSPGGGLMITSPAIRADVRMCAAFEMASTFFLYSSASASCLRSNSSWSRRYRGRGLPAYRVEGDHTGTHGQVVVVGTARLSYLARFYPIGWCTALTSSQLLISM
jgi:hypothetical protein